MNWRSTAVLPVPGGPGPADADAESDGVDGAFLADRAVQVFQIGRGLEVELAGVANAAQLVRWQGF